MQINILYTNQYISYITSFQINTSLHFDFVIIYIVYLLPISANLAIYTSFVTDVTYL